MSQFKGKVAWFNNVKGFGILARENAPDVFCHYSAIELTGYKSLKEGEPVEFDIEHGDKGPQAAHVRKVQMSVGVFALKNDEGSKADQTRTHWGCDFEAEHNRQVHLK